jgi:hypothetical protein
MIFEIINDIDKVWERQIGQLAGIVRESVGFDIREIRYLPTKVYLGIFKQSLTGIASLALGCSKYLSVLNWDVIHPLWGSS